MLRAAGNTGWIELQYTIGTSGDYLLAFGVTNFNDTVFDSGLIDRRRGRAGTGLACPVGIGAAGPWIFPPSAASELSDRRAAERGS